MRTPRNFDSLMKRDWWRAHTKSLLILYFCSPLFHKSFSSLQNVLPNSRPGPGSRLRSSPGWMCSGRRSGPRGCRRSTAVSSRSGPGRPPTPPSRSWSGNGSPAWGSRPCDPNVEHCLPTPPHPTAPANATCARRESFLIWQKRGNRGGCGSHCYGVRGTNYFRM